MIHVNGKQISLLGNDISAFTCVAEDKIKEALVIRANQEVVGNSYKSPYRISGKQ